MQVYLYFFLCEEDGHLFQYDENLDAYLTSGSINCIKKLLRLLVDPITRVVIEKPAFSLS